MNHYNYSAALKINFGRNFNRLIKGKKRKELMEHIGVSKGAIISWEKGERMPPTISLYRIAKFFNVSVESLLED